MKLKSLQKEFSVYDDNNEITGIVSMKTDSKTDDTSINISVLSNSLHFDSIEEFEEFVNTILKNAQE